MGNGHFGAYIVETPNLSRPSAIPPGYDPIVYHKREQSPHTTHAAFTTPVGGSLSNDCTSRDWTLPKGLDKYQNQNPSSTSCIYSSYNASNHSTILSNGAGTSFSCPSTTAGTAINCSGFPETRNLCQSCNRYNRVIADEFNLKYKGADGGYRPNSGGNDQPYITGKFDPIPQPQTNAAMPPPPALPSKKNDDDGLYKISENNNFLPAVTSSFVITPPSCCDQYKSPSMVDFLKGTEAGLLIAGVCGNNTQPQHRPQLDDDFKRNVSKGAQTSPPTWIFVDGGLRNGKFMPIRNDGKQFLPEYGNETKEAQTSPYVHDSGGGRYNNFNNERNPTGFGNNQDGPGGVIDPYGGGEDGNNVNHNKEPDGNGENVNNGPNDKSGNMNDDPNGIKGHENSVPDLLEGVPNSFSEGDPIGNVDASGGGEPIKDANPPYVATQKSNINIKAGNDDSGRKNVKKTKSGKTPEQSQNKKPKKKEKSKSERGSQTDTNVNQPLSSKDIPLRIPPAGWDSPDVPYGGGGTLLPTWSDGRISHSDPTESKDPFKPGVRPSRTSDPTPANKPTTSSSEHQRRNSDPGTIPSAKRTKSPQPLPILAADRHSINKFKETASRTKSSSIGGPVEQRRQSDPLPESRNSKMLVNRTKAKSVPELNLSNLPLTPAISLKGLEFGKRRKSSVDEIMTPLPPKTVASPSWFDVMPMSTMEEEEESSSKRKSEKKIKKNSINPLTKDRKSLPSKSALKKKSSTTTGVPPTPRTSTPGTTKAGKPTDQGATKARSIRFVGIPPTPPTP